VIVTYGSSFVFALLLPFFLCVMDGNYTIMVSRQSI